MSGYFWGCVYFYTWDAKVASQRTLRTDVGVFVDRDQGADVADGSRDALSVE